MRYNVVVCVLVLVVLVLSGCTTQQSNDNQEKDGETEFSSLWVKDPDMILAGTTSTCSLVFDDGTVRMYFMDADGGISYMDSADGKNFSDALGTDIPNNPRPMDPAVVYIQEIYLMFYRVMINPGEPGEQSVDELWRAESPDGISFVNYSKVAGPSSDNSQPVNVPDVIVLSDDRLRIYATQMHDGINTAVSNDLGKTWVNDGQNLVSLGACDPDVHMEDDGTYVMYYTDTVIPDYASGWSKDKIKEEKIEENYIRKVVSSDGLKWEKSEEDVIGPLPELPSNGCVFDPDYVKLSDWTEVIYFARATGEEKDHGTINVYRAVKTT